jgi:hypothetical protein
VRSPERAASPAVARILRPQPPPRMSFLENGKQMVLDQLREKAVLKQALCAQSAEVFARFKAILGVLEAEFRNELSGWEKPPRLLLNEKGENEMELVFGGDVLYFTRHTNIFNFEPTHAVQQSDYVREDPTRAYCAMIQVYNFLFDSIDQQRPADPGYLIARIFFNKEGHFFVEGKRQLGFLYNEFGSAELNDVYIRGIIESAMIYAIDFDLLVPPYEKVQVLTVQQKMLLSGLRGLETGKRVGFRFQAEQEATAQG